MTQFFFHVRDGEKLLKDTVGIDLPDVHIARQEASQSARELLAENLKYGDQLDHRQYEVWDESGSPLFTLPFRSVIEP